MKKNVFLFLSAVAAVFYGCSSDDNGTETAIQTAFVNQSVNLSASDTNVPIAFSSPTTAAGTITVTLEPTNVVYGTDFTTNPAASGGIISIPFSEGASSVSLTFTKLIDAIEGQTKNVKFTISAVSLSNVEIPAATNFTQLNFNETAISQNTTIAENGGNTIPNQVYVDLSSGSENAVPRTSWELGFYSGSEFRVVLNPAVNKLAVKQLATSNIDEVQVADPAVTTGNYEASGAGYIDNPYGNLTISATNLTATAIAEVSATDADNKVYLVNLGQTVSSTPATGTSAALTGTDRGWKKIRILRSGNDYKLQYANIDATTHTEVTISKNAAYNHTFFSLVNGAAVSAEPQKDKWDITLTPFMNYTPYNGQNVSYYFGDVVLTNSLAGTKAYEVFTSAFTYDSFTAANVVASNFETSAAADRRAIGANWRSTVPLAVKTDRFYVIKDVAGNLYKLKFTSLLSSASERGTTTFEYAKLN
ncbi:MAG: HmuY family protein [Flavobacterium sp.]